FVLHRRAEKNKSLRTKYWTADWCSYLRHLLSACHPERSEGPGHFFPVSQQLLGNRFLDRIFHPLHRTRWKRRPIPTWRYDDALRTFNDDLVRGEFHM